MLMVKAGRPVDLVIESLLPWLEAGDIVIDGGNSQYQDSERRTEGLAAQGILFIGTGVSGGEEGALLGPSIMPGGNPDAWPHMKPIFQAIAAKTDDGEPCCDWVGRGGAGHFVKMVHNGIEYGDMQMICETYQMMKEGLGMSNDEMHAAFARWNEGVLDSYLVEITAEILGTSDPATGARQVPIYQTTAYVFRDAEHAAALFNLQEVGFIYSRLTNPTVSALAERITHLEGGADIVFQIGTAKYGVRDAEGATKFVSISVAGGRDAQECLQVAYTVAHSPLVKTALYASDPNWGRILAAVGRAGVADLDVDKVGIFLGDVCIVRDGGRAPDYREQDGQRVMNQDEIGIRIELGRGSASETVWTSDLSDEYVRINAEYRS